MPTSLRTRREEAAMNIQAPVPGFDDDVSLLGISGGQLRTLPGNRDVQLARAKLLQDLHSKGVPTRRIESWHYTDLRSRVKPPAGPVSVRHAPLAREPLVAGSIVLQANDPPSDGLAGISGVSVHDYRDALADGSAAVRLVARNDDDAIGRINGALVQDGLAVEVAAGARLKSPLELQIPASGSFHARFTVTFQADAKATVIERHVGADEHHERLVTAVSDLHVGKGAEVTWIIVQLEGASDSHLGQLNFILEENARLRLLVLNAGGKLVRQELHGRQSGEGAQLVLCGINLLSGNSHTDVTMTLEHEAVGTTSAEMMRNIVFDRASGVFQGGIKVAPGAQKTDARMACNTLLLSDEGQFFAKPELEIFADDVQCGHGATVADIDDTHLYYLMARGIPKARARSLLIKGFLAELLVSIEDERIVEALDQTISAWLDQRD
jgi:Fe-S cluster assembly protein SufD